MAVQAQRATDTFKLYFDLNIPSLNSATEKKIDLLIYNDKIINGTNIMVVGYADYLGSESHNKNLSMQRAKNVMEYLVKYGINEKDIKVCLGKGEVNRYGHNDRGGYPTDRRVDIVVNNKVRHGSRPKKDTARKTSVSSIDEITKLKPGSIFQLKKVYFPADRHVISPESMVTLEKLYKVLKDHPNLKISIEGHVCCIPQDAADAKDIDTEEPILSVNRAKEIYNYLVKKGIDPRRLRYEGFGKRRPVVMYEKNEEDAEKNRRVEIRVIENN